MEKSLKSATDKIIIGKVGAAQGLKGEFRVHPLTDFPDRFTSLKSCYIDEELVEITSTKYHKNFVLMKIKNLDKREEVQQIINKLVKVDLKDVPPLGDGEYYSFQIIGLSVFNEKGEALGTIKQILKTGANDVYVVQKDDGTEILVPALKKVVTKIDLDNKRMYIIWQEPVEA